MIRRTLPAVFALLCSSPLLAGQQTLFSFVRPASVVNVATVDAGMPQYNAEQTAEGEVVRVSFEQRYQSGNYSDVVNKQLEWVKDGGDWKIRREAQL